MAKGPPMFKNFSLGAVAAIRLRPPTMPAVYQAALSTIGPPNNVTGAIIAPIRPECKIQAKLFELIFPCS